MLERLLSTSLEDKSLKPIAGRERQLHGIRQASLRGKVECLTRQRRRFSLSSSDIITVKKAALRRGIWFRVLNRVERGVLDLTTRYVDYIKSAKLANVVTAILNKLNIAAESMVERLVRTVGLSIAQKISCIAVSWGNRSASNWADSADFARYLAVTQLNSR